MLLDSHCGNKINVFYLLDIQILDIIPSTIIENLSQSLITRLYAVFIHVAEIDVIDEEQNFDAFQWHNDVWFFLSRQVAFKRVFGLFLSHILAVASQIELGVGVLLDFSHQPVKLVAFSRTSQSNEHKGMARVYKQF